MSFRFQKRIKIAPGLRLNLSKGGVSTSVGKRGASVTLGKRGLYGNVGIPGSGLSYRTRIDPKLTGNLRNGKNVPITTTSHVQLAYDKKNHSVVFLDENGQGLPTNVERDLKRKFKQEIELLYREKEAEINDQTEKLLDLHHQLFPLYNAADLRDMVVEKTNIELDKPSQVEIFKTTEEAKRKSLGLIGQLALLLPSKRKAFSKQINDETNLIYQQALQEYTEDHTALEEEKHTRLQLLEGVIEGNKEAIENWVELHLSELDFPLETNVAFKVLSSDTIYFDVDLPQIEDIPLTKATIMKSGKLKVENKTQRETREHYALMISGTAFYICSFAFAFIPTITRVIISGYSQYLNEATGHMDDKYLYSLAVDQDIFYSLNFDALHPITAFENFKHRFDATKTYIIKEIEPFNPDEFR